MSTRGRTIQPAIANEEAGLLDDIVGDPASDTPRLIYADWLADNGREGYGDFIRRHIALDRMRCPPQDFHTESCKRCLECEELWAAFMSNNWANVGITGTVSREPGSNMFVFDGGRMLEFRRGFPYYVSLRLKQWLRYGKAIAIRQPVEWVHIYNVYPDQRPASFGSETSMASVLHRKVDGVVHTGGAGQAVLPPELFGKLTGAVTIGHVAYYGSDRKAAAGLSDACLALARGDSGE